MSLRDHLQAIYDKHGRLTPMIVVAEARDPEHPLHPSVFDVPPSEAAERYYIDRAHSLIVSVRIAYRKAEDAPVETVRAWHAIPNTGEDGPGGFVYEPTEKIVSDPLLSKLVLREMERDWKALRRRYQQFQEFWDIVRGDLQASA